MCLIHLCAHKAQSSFPLNYKTLTNLCFSPCPVPYQGSSAWTWVCFCPRCVCPLSPDKAYVRHCPDALAEASVKWKQNSNPVKKDLFKRVIIAGAERSCCSQDRGPLQQSRCFDCKICTHLKSSAKRVLFYWEEQTRLEEPGAGKCDERVPRWNPRSEDVLPRGQSVLRRGCEPAKRGYPKGQGLKEGEKLNCSLAKKHRVPMDLWRQAVQLVIYGGKNENLEGLCLALS